MGPLRGNFLIEPATRDDDVVALTNLEQQYVNIKERFRRVHSQSNTVSAQCGDMF